MDFSEPVRITEYKEDMVLQVSRRSCEICLENAAKYTCPRCNVSYCSVDCFKHQRHSGCSESFYKDCFIQEMQMSKADDKEKRRIVEMLKKFEEENVCEDADSASLEERLRNVNLNDSDEVWMRLTPDEQAEFRKRLQNGSLVTCWKPWWRQRNTSLISEIDSESLKKSSLPHYILEVPQLSTLLRGKAPSVLIRNNIVDVLYSYAYFCRLYNGNTQDFSFEIPHDVITSSRFLSHGITTQTCGEAISGAINGCIKREGTMNEPIHLEVVLDVYHILLGPDEDHLCTYVKAALSELHALCTKLMKHSRRQKKISSLSLNLVFSSMKKLEFLVSWVNDNESALLRLSFEVIAYYKNRKSFERENKRRYDKLERIRKSVPKHAEPSVLIEEIE